ncbi:MAG: amino acid adenylation domain-containing protein, partial [Solobacterium sp.]|nr:amino acid adenylation domain-containing protein [Solobacterium sp.]
AYENQEYPFEELVEAVDVVRDMSRNPLFDVMLVLQNNEEVAVSLGGNRAEWAESDDTIAKLDLGFDISENDSDFTIGVEYCTDLFTKDSIQKLVDRYLLLLEKFTDDPSVKLESIELLREEEKNLILNTFNDTRTEYSVESSFVALFEEEVRKHPDHTAVVFENESLTYAELNAKANQVALKLRDLGVKRNDLVSMLTERSLEMIVGIFGIMKAGGAYLPMDPTYPEDRIAYMLEDSSAKAILTYKSSLETEIPVIDLGNSDVFNGASENLEPVNTPDDLLYCIYTSGTTGKPKGVLIEHRNACNLARYMQCELGINETDHILLFANYIFDGSVWEILTALVNGAALYIPTDETIRDIDAMKCFVSEKNITVSYFPPQYYEQGRFELGKYVITAGSAASMSVVESVLENSGYINSYGPTEATVCISNWILRKGDKPEKITIGKPISNVQVYIVQGDTLCGVGVPGELCASGAGIARGYLNRPELTAEKFVKNPYGKGKMYHTGDLARWLPDGSIEYLGRIDEQIKIRGFRVELGEIDSRIREMDLVKDCAVIARSDANGDKAICAYVVGDEEINVSQIRDALSKSLP